MGWEQAFKNFNDRYFLSIQKPIVGLNQAFKEFRALEVRTWTDVCRQPGASEYFVRPSGMLDSLLAHHLHPPSMTTTKLKDGATADSSNGCIRMIMNNGYKQGETLIFDHLHQRSKMSDGVKTYPHEILGCHEGFTRQIYESMTSPVVIIYRQTVQERALRHMQIEHTIFPLGIEQTVFFSSCSTRKALAMLDQVTKFAELGCLLVILNVCSTSCKIVQSHKCKTK